MPHTIKSFGQQRQPSGGFTSFGQQPQPAGGFRSFGQQRQPSGGFTSFGQQAPGAGGVGHQGVTIPGQAPGGGLAEQFQSATDSANAANQKRLRRIMKIIRKTGKQAKQDIREGFDEQQTQATQRLLSAGLSNTTVPGGVAAGIERQRGQAINRLQDQIQQQRAGVLERVQDVGPDQAFLAQLAAGQGAASASFGGGGGGGLLAQRNAAIRQFGSIAKAQEAGALPGGTTQQQPELRRTTGPNQNVFPDDQQQTTGGSQSVEEALAPSATMNAVQEFLARLQAQEQNQQGTGFPEQTVLPGPSQQGGIGIASDDPRLQGNVSPSVFQQLTLKNKILRGF